MNTAKEIFDLYFSQSISINSQEEFEKLVILPAMEAYAKQTFEAAQQIDSTGQHQFTDFISWQEYMKPPAIEPVDNQRIFVEEMADTILPHYIPADGTVKDLSFTFASECKQYEVAYQKDAEDYWCFTGYNEV